jgi:hypothetical protein
MAIGRAMLNVTANGCAKAILENKDIAVLGR